MLVHWVALQLHLYDTNEAALKNAQNEINKFLKKDYHVGKSQQTEVEAAKYNLSLCISIWKKLQVRQI